MTWKNSGFERDLNPRPLRYRCNALPTKLSKPHESGCVNSYQRAEPRHDRSHVALKAQLVEHCTGNAKAMGSNPVSSKPEFFQVIFPVVLWLHSHLSFFHLKLSSYLHNLITLCPVFRCCCCFKSFYAIRSSKQTFLKFQHKDKEPLPGCTIEISYLFLFTLIYLII